MEADTINDLIAKAHNFLEKGDFEKTKQCVLKAIIGTNNEKEKFLNGLEKTVEEQQLADWYGECSFIMNKVGEKVTATRCFYTATVFDKQWRVDTHTEVSLVLWTDLLFSKDIFLLMITGVLDIFIQDTRRLLVDLDSIAKLAEKRKKWSVCIAIDGDINRGYSFLRQKMLLPQNIITQPGRKSAMWRIARCYLELNLHREVRKVCSTILQHLCDYDDSEALWIWARSLYMTEDFDLALKKNDLALKYCQDSGDKDKLEAFKTEIEEKLGEKQEHQAEPDDNWLEGTNAHSANVGDGRSHQTPERKKKRHKRPKAIDRSKESTPQPRSRSVDRHQKPNSFPKERSASTAPERREKINEKSPAQVIPELIERLKLKDKVTRRYRQVSGCSTSTIGTEASGFGTETSNDSLSESDSDVDDSSNAYSSRAETPDIEQLSDEDIEIDDTQDTTSFYERSFRFYQEYDGMSDRLKGTAKEENLLKTGITLNMSYLHRFEDNNTEREPFYSEFFEKDKLQQLMMRNPKRYIKCVIQIEGCHEAYCTPVDAHESIHVIEISGRSKIGQVFNEDEVVVEILDDQHVKDKRYGKVVGIWNRQRHRDTKHPVFICTLDDMDSHNVRPMCKTIPKIHILDREIKQKYPNAKSRRYKVEMYTYDERAGILCDPKIVNINPANQSSVLFLVAYINWGRRHIYPRGAIIKHLASGKDIATGLSVLNLQHEVPTLYKRETVEQVTSLIKRIGDEPSEYMLRDRVDLTELNTFTIDPPDSQDLDDALSVEKIDGGFKVGVHIADVAEYVGKDTSLDEEARNRATTFYPGIQKPRNMIPEPLSSNICSLIQGKTRLTLSVFFYIGHNGRLMQTEGNNVRVAKSYIQSKHQLTYGQVQAIISSQPQDDEDVLTRDIKHLFRLAHNIRRNRLGNAMMALDIDWEETQMDESEGDTREAHYLVEEFMIMANKKVAEKLVKVYKDCIPLRIQPPPTQESLDHFFHKNNQYIDILVKFQDKQLGPKQPNVEECLTKQTTQTVMISKSVWEAMKKSPKSNAVGLIRKDDIHPLQLVVYQHWLSIQEKAGYKCFTGQEHDTHFSLNTDRYTHFTSPIRRYNDLIVQRLIHAVIDRKPSPYRKEEIDSICMHINSVAKRAKAYEKGCRSLQRAIDLKSNPKMLGCYVDDVTEQGFTLCSPVMKYVAKANRELSFNRLDMCSKPEIFEDPHTNWNRGKGVWRKRIYDFNVRPNYHADTDKELKLNPHTGILFIPLHEWARMVKCTIHGHVDDLGSAIKKANVTRHGEGLDDISTECSDPLKIQPTTRFSMTFSRGQQVKVQMTAGPYKGMIAPKPMLYNMTNNVKCCLLHTEDPVLHLSRYVNRGTYDQYKSRKLYLETWLPLMSMEAATGVVRNEESCTINNVNIRFSGERKGKFVLGLAECEVRNIELSGTVSDDDEADDESGDANSYDWLCIKSKVPSTKSNDKRTVKDLQTFDPVWVAHAEVTKVKRKRDDGSGKLTVSFSLHEQSPLLPTQFYQQKPAEHKFAVEILRKSEVDRRTESFLKKLRTMDGTLSEKIALKRKIPDLDKDHKHIASLIERDIYYEAHNDDPRRKPLPPNNKKQQEAIDKALMSRFSLIQGPPGTGKTYTGIKLVSLFNKINGILHKEGKQKKQVLYCGPSNRSVDLVAEWMYNRMGNYCPDFVRVYGRSIEAMDFPIPGRTFLSKRSTRHQKTSPVLYPVALHHLIRQKDKKYAELINAYDKLFKENNYEPMPEKVAEYVRIVREASIDEIRRHDVILCTTAVGSNPKVLKATKVHQVIVDEAGMCPEPQCLVPIIATEAEQVVLIGDHKQLRPIIMCKEAAQLGLETSLFERYATAKSPDIHNIKFTMLEEQYRMNPQICQFPSQQFYNNALKTRPGLWCGRPMKIWPTDIGTTYPHILVDVEGEEKMLTVSTEDGNEHSKSNHAEIDEVIKVYSYFTREQPQESVQILSQYNAQVAEIKRRLVSEGYVDENVSTVVSSQGGEWDYVIFSTVRSLPKYKIEPNPTLGWCKHNLGFIIDQNQVNVALTRARKGLIIIGNKDLLSCDNVWKKLISHYEQRGCVKSPDEFPPKARRTRLQKMRENIQESERRYGDARFVKGEATSYSGSFEESQGGRNKRRRRHNQEMQL